MTVKKKIDNIIKSVLSFLTFLVSERTTVIDCAV